MVIRLAYDMIQPCVLNGTLHTGDDSITTCSLLADTMRWRPSLLYRLSISSQRRMMCHRRAEVWQVLQRRVRLCKLEWGSKHRTCELLVKLSYERSWWYKRRNWKWLNVTDKIIYCLKYCNWFKNVTYSYFRGYSVLFLLQFTIFSHSSNA
jgi:hypothetical protein